jgi:hypothetical protein
MFLLLCLGSVVHWHSIDFQWILRAHVAILTVASLGERGRNRSRRRGCRTSPAGCSSEGDDRDYDFLNRGEWPEEARSNVGFRRALLRQLQQHQAVRNTGEHAAWLGSPEDALQKLQDRRDPSHHLLKGIVTLATRTDAIRDTNAADGQCFHAGDEFHASRSYTGNSAAGYSSLQPGTKVVIDYIGSAPEERARSSITPRFTRCLVIRASRDAWSYVVDAAGKSKKFNHTQIHEMLGHTSF